MRKPALDLRQEWRSPCDLQRFYHPRHVNLKQTMILEKNVALGIEGYLEVVTLGLER